MRKQILYLGLVLMIIGVVNATDIPFGYDYCDENPGGIGFNKMYQNFTYVDSVSLTGGKIYLGSLYLTPGDMTVRLKEGAWDSLSYLATSTVSLDAGDAGTWVTYSFDAPYTIAANQEYWLEFVGDGIAQANFPMDCGSGPGVVWYEDTDILYSIWMGLEYPLYDTLDQEYPEWNSQLLMNLTYTEPVPDFPYQTEIVDTLSISIDTNACAPVGDKLYCIDYPHNIWEYDITAKTWQIVGDILSVSEGNLPFSWHTSCNTYNSEVYCTGSYNSNYGESQAEIFKYDTLTFTATELADLDGGSQANEDCAFRPGTDELWCYGWDSTTTYSAIRYYDVSDDAWTNVNDDRDSYLFYLDSMSCDFRNSNEFWCFGGYDNTEISNDDLMKYDISGNIVTRYDSGLGMAGAYCRWYDDTFICYGGDAEAENGVVMDSSLIYDPDTDTTVIYKSPFIPPILTLGDCTKYDLYTDYCIGSYLDGWDYDQEVKKITYGIAPPEPEPEPVVETKRTGGSSSFVIAQQNLAKQAEATQSKPTNIVDALIQVIHNIRRALRLE